MTDEIAVGEEEKPGLTLVQFLRQFFGNYRGFLETHLKTDKPPFFLLMIWFLGMASVIDRMELRYVLSNKYQLEDWVSTWLLIAFAGVFSGLMGYWVGGGFYHLRVLISGGLRNFKTSRYLFLYTGLPLYAVAILSEVFDTAVYGQKYFTEPTSWDLDMIWIGLALGGIAYSISLSYRGVRLLQLAKRIRSIIFFIILPSLFYALVLGGTMFKVFSEYSKGLDYNEQAIEAMLEDNYERAEELLLQALKYMSKDEREDIMIMYENLAMVHEYQDDKEAAVDCYEEMLALCDSNSFEYHSIMGKMKIVEDSIPLAIAHFERSLQLEPDNADGHNQLGTIYLGIVDEEIENFERALIHNERAYALDPNPGNVENLAVSYFSLGRYSDAQPLFESLEELLPDYALPKYYLGLIHWAYGDLEKAVELLEQAVLLNPDLFNEDVEEIFREAAGQTDRT